MDDRFLFEMPPERPSPSGVEQPRAGGHPRVRRAVRNQVSFRACALDDLLPEEHPARIVLAFVEGLDLGPLYDRIAAVVGQPGHPPADPRILFTLWLYATLRGIGRPARPPAWRRRMVETRQIRQKILDRTDGTAPELIAVITEASLMYRWGTKPDRREQIMKLVELGARPNIELRMQRFIDGPPTGMHSMVNIFDCPTRSPASSTWRPITRSRR